MSDYRVWRLLAAAAMMTAGAVVTAAVPAAAATVRPVDTVIEAESYDAQRGTRVIVDPTASGGRAVTRIGNGDWLRYDGVDFGASPATASGFARWRWGQYGPGTIELRLDRPDSTPLVSVTLASSQGRCCTWEWSSVRHGSSEIYGVHTVYLTFRSDSPRSYFALDAFQVLKQTWPPIP
ncbi:carbohydrate-binding protein [Planosporangium sp. 12N6]|uniref:carbohydrate-binding protein n=1 Tax=Planosporangium spinosum TaxID=3402278 RepID=UPI003CE9AA23